MDQTPARIAGAAVTTERDMAVVSPYDGGVVANVPACDAGHVDAACTAAAAALARDDFPQAQRARVLEVAAATLRDRVDDFARTIAREAGKPIRTARGEVNRCVDTLTFAAVEARTLSGEVLPMAASDNGAGKLGFALRVPLGVIGAIAPFNFPLNLVAHKLAPAVAAGCPVVCKPADATPLSALAFVDLLVESGMPPDWISVVTGTGADAGAPLVEHPVPAMITFTGSTSVGWGIAAAAPRKRVSLELGSNAPVIVEPDADLVALAGQLRGAGFSYAGQSCISVQRVLVHRSVHTDLVGHLDKAVSSLVVGDPLDEATDVGPVINAAAAQRVRGWIDEAVDGGARLVTGGELLRDGLLTPAVVDQPPAGAKLLHEEAFGPVIVVVPYDDFDEALTLANDSDLALHAALFSNDLAKAMRAVKELDFGGVLVNEVPTYRADQQPYGGLRESGNTREGPAYAVREMTELKFISLPAS